nr:hypothetical protein HK105_001383 [Polyrhizophydium stewartii]
MMCTYKNSIVAGKHFSDGIARPTLQQTTMAQSLQERLERLEALVSQHQLMNALDPDDPVNPATFGVSMSTPASVTAPAPLAREELKAFFISSLRPHLLLMTADQVLYCAAESPLATYAICAMSALFAPETLLPPGKATELFLAYFKAAKACVSNVFDLPRPSSVFGLLLMTMASSADRGPRITYYYGSVVQMAMRLGLNKEDSVARAQSDFHKALMRNVWWSIYAFDRWLQTVGIGIDVIKDAECSVSLPASEGWLAAIPPAVLQERTRLEIAIVSSSLPFIPSLPNASPEATYIMLAKITGHIVAFHRATLKDNSVIDPVVQMSLERSLQDLYANLPEYVRNLDQFLALYAAYEAAVAAQASSEATATNGPSTPGGGSTPTATATSTPTPTLGSVQPLNGAGANPSSPQPSTPQASSFPFGFGAEPVWVANRSLAFFINSGILSARVTLLRSSLLSRFLTQPAEQIMASREFFESFDSVKRSISLIRTFQRVGKDLGVLLILLITDLFNVSLTLPVALCMPLSEGDLAVVTEALNLFCAALDMLSSGIAPSPSYSQVVRTICNSRDRTYIVKAINLASRDLDSPSLPDFPSQFAWGGRSLAPSSSDSDSSVGTPHVDMTDGPPRNGFGNSNPTLPMQIPVTGDDSSRTSPPPTQGAGVPTFGTTTGSFAAHAAAIMNAAAAAATAAAAAAAAAAPTPRSTASSAPDSLAHFGGLGTLGLQHSLGDAQMQALSDAQAQAQAQVQAHAHVHAQAQAQGLQLQQQLLQLQQQAQQTDASKDPVAHQTLLQQIAYNQQMQLQMQAQMQHAIIP